MCTNYRPSSRDLIREQFGAAVDFEFPDETYPAYVAPILRASDDGTTACIAACFGLIPRWSRDAKLARSTYSARSETVATKPSFRAPWRERRYCLVPMQSFFEPRYDGERSTRWRIERADGSDFCVAGIWESWRSPTGPVAVSFSMLTINADRHALMSQFHAPGDEKRSLVVIDPAQYRSWLQATPPQAAALLRPFDATAFRAAADPRPARRRKPAATGDA